MSHNTQPFGQRLREMIASPVFLAASGVGGALLLFWPLVTIPSQTGGSGLLGYIYCVWGLLAAAAGLWAYCQPDQDEPGCDANRQAGAENGWPPADSPNSGPAAAPRRGEAGP